MNDGANSDRGHGVIRLRVREISQLFNSLDPDPFIERDLDDDAARYIESWAREIGKHQPLRLVVHIADPKGHTDQQALIEASVRNYYGQMVELARNEFRELMRRGRLSLLIGLMVLAVSMAGAHLVGAALADRTWGDLAREGIMIGGWVAMWRPLEIFLYDWWPLRRKRLDFERLRDMRVEVILPPAQG
ncbi:MAG: hypothetical protein HS108_03785 [Planctomycetes bacterium]|jgi:hypothetical protein|nr:hypothetical protein [Planctomycetota bacterium]